MAATAPPPVWQSDVFRNITNYDTSQQVQGPQAANPSAGSRAQSGEQVAEAYRHVRQVVTDARRDFDLYDLLASTRREDTYQPYVQGWPSLLRATSPTLFDLPAMVQEKYRTCQTMCFCGLFPQIKRAWASIDNSLFLWRYDKSGDVPVEYCGEDQAICAVGIVKPKPGVFLEAIHHIIVLCTTVEVVLLGVCPTRGVGGMAGDPDDITLQPLPMYSVPSDNVVMTCVAASSAGRIFLGGSDGHLYEVLYSAADSWRQKRCTKVRLTGGLQQYLPSFIPSLLGFGAPTAVDKLAVDNERHILYALTQSSAIHVFDLGASGTETPRKVAEVSDFYAAASSATNGREVFRGSSGERKTAAVRHIAPIGTSESQKLHLVAVTADGRRVYFTTTYLRMNSYYSSSYSGAGTANQQQAGVQERPTTLTAVFARSALPHVGAAAAPAIGRVAAPDLGRSGALEVVAAHYAHGTLVLSEAAGSDGRTTKVLVAGRSSTLPPPSVNVAATSATQPGLREVITELDNFIPGETCAIEAAPLRSALGPESNRGMQDELFTQVFNPPPRFVLISTAGVIELEKRRPIDILQQILEERSSDKLRQFFEAFGPPEAAAMCFMVAASRPGQVSAVAVREATAALEQVVLVGEPRLPEDVMVQQPMGEMLGRGTTGGIYMGHAVNPNPEPDWSAAHRGLCLYITRLLQPAWDQRIVTSSKCQAKLLKCRLSMETMTVLVDKMCCLVAFINEFLSRRQQRGAASRYSPVRALGGGGGLFGLGDGLDDSSGIMGQAAKRQRLTHAAMLEDERTARIRSLASKTTEALLLLQLLSTNNLGRLAARLDDATTKALCDMNLRDLVCDAEGEAVATKLISVLVTEQLDLGGTGPRSAGAGVEEIAAALQRGCPSYFKEDDRTFYQASAKLKQAEALTNPSEREALTREAVAQLRRVPLACNLEFLVSQLAYLRQFEGIVEIPLCAAAAADPDNLAQRPELGPDCERARQRREGCYIHIISTLKALINPAAAEGPLAAAVAGTGAPAAGGQKGLSPAERATYKNAILKAAIRSSDLYFHHVLYGALIDLGAANELLALEAAHLEGYLAQEGGLSAALPLLAAASAAGGVATVPAPVIGPLTRRQVQLAELLAKYHIIKKRFREASTVYSALAARRSGPGDQAVTLEQRVSAYQSALLQAKSVGDSALVDKADSDFRLMGFQKTIYDRLMERKAAGGAGVDAAELDRRASELQYGLRDISELYNDYAQPLKMWDVCLQLVDFAGSSVDPALIRQLWDHFLIQTWEASSAAAPASRVASVAEAVERLGAPFYPNESSFPVAHVAFRLEQLAAGVWPASDVSDTERTTDEAVVRALHGACKGNLAAVQRVYEVLLARRAPGISDVELSSVRVKTQLLRSLVHHCRAVQQEVASALVTPGLLPPAVAAAGGVPVGAIAAGAAAPGSGGLFYMSALSTAQREAGALADACDRFSIEARRLGTAECDALAAQLDTVKRQLERTLR